MKTENMYYNQQKRSEVKEEARRLRRKFLRYQQAEIVYSLSHKKRNVSSKKRGFEMHGKVWMFSHLIDDEDIEFMQHEFISYRQAMDYYNLGYKPIVRLSHKAGAVYKIGKKVLIKRSTFEKYLRENIRREKEEWEKLYQ